MSALARTFEFLFGSPWWISLPSSEQWKLTTVRPLLERLNAMGGVNWRSEDAVCAGDVGMSIIGARCFWAKDLGLIEYRQRFMRGRGYWMRLTPKGLRYVRESNG
jgi:hypothetical protein